MTRLIPLSFSFRADDLSNGCAGIPDFPLQRKTNRGKVRTGRYRTMSTDVTNAEAKSDSEVDPNIPEGVLASMQAFWRDLPEMLTHRRWRDRLVCYHRNERIGIAKTSWELLEKCEERNLTDDEWFIGRIWPEGLPPWIIEEIEGGGHEIDYDPEEIPDESTGETR